MSGVGGRRRQRPLCTGTGVLPEPRRAGGTLPHLRARLPALRLRRRPAAGRDGTGAGHPVGRPGGSGRRPGRAADGGAGGAAGRGRRRPRRTGVRRGSGRPAARPGSPDRVARRTAEPHVRAAVRQRVAGQRPGRGRRDRRGRRRPVRPRPGVGRRGTAGRAGDRGGRRVAAPLVAVGRAGGRAEIGRPRDEAWARAVATLAGGSPWRWTTPMCGRPGRPSAP